MEHLCPDSCLCSYPCPNSEPPPDPPLILPPPPIFFLPCPISVPQAGRYVPARAAASHTIEISRFCLYFCRTSQKKFFRVRLFFFFFTSVGRRGSGGCEFPAGEDFQQIEINMLSFFTLLHFISFLSFPFLSFPLLYALLLSIHRFSFPSFFPVDIHYNHNPRC